MKHVTALLLLVLFSISIHAQDEDLKKQIATQQEKMNAAVEENNVPALDKLMHPNFYVHQLNGPFIPKDTLLNRFRKEGSHYKVFRPEASTFIRVDKNTVITSGKETFQHRTGKYAAKEHQREFLQVWIRFKGEWLLAARNVVYLD